MEQFTCITCHHVFKNLANMKKHQRTSVLCLNMQQQIDKYNTLFNTLKELEELSDQKDTQLKDLRVKNEKLLEELSMKNEELRETIKLSEISNRVQCNSHHTEVTMLKTSLKIYEAQNKSYQDQLINKATAKKNIITNNQINLISFLSPEAISKKIKESFTHDIMFQGVFGAAKWIRNNIASDSSGNLLYTCTDPARKFFKCMDTEGHEVKDVKATKFLTAVNPGLIEKTRAHHIRYSNELMDYNRRYAEGERDDHIEEQVKRFGYKEKQCLQLYVDLSEPGAPKLVNELVRELAS